MKGDSGQNGDQVSSLKYLQKLWPSKQHLLNARSTLFSDLKKKKRKPEGVMLEEVIYLFLSVVSLCQGLPGLPGKQGFRGRGGQSGVQGEIGPAGPAGLPGPTVSASYI